MKKRVHIHRETIGLTGELKHFSIVLPADVKKIVSIKVTATPEGQSPNLRHNETGRLRLGRDGFVLCDLPVWFGGVEPKIFPLIIPGIINGDTQTFRSGKKNEDFALAITGSSRVIFCKHENGDTFSDYMLAIYINYESK